jgi:hypothetical protein
MACIPPADLPAGLRLPGRADIAFVHGDHDNFVLGYGTTRAADLYHQSVHGFILLDILLVLLGRWARPTSSSDPFYWAPFRFWFLPALWL